VRAGESDFALGLHVSAALDAAEAERIGLADRGVAPIFLNCRMAIDRRTAGNLPVAEIKRVISGVSAARAIASFARLLGCGRTLASRRPV
jgi:enoyl-CoA hydratase